MRGLLVVGATLAMNAVSCSSPSPGAGRGPTATVPHETLGTIAANPDPILLGVGGASAHPPGASWRGGPALSVAASWRYSCEIRFDHTIECWGMGAPPPSGEFSALSLNSYHGCGLRLDGTLACFGAGTTDQNCVDHECGQSRPPSGVFLQVSAGNLHSCAITDNGRVVCWGAGETNSACTIEQCGQAAPPPGTFSKVAAGYHHSCALAVDGMVQCWGEASEAVAPTVAFEDIFGGPFGSCGLHHDGSLECWGPGGVLALPEPPRIAFSSAAVGVGWVCGISKVEGALICWGQDMGGNLNAPAGSFKQAALGDRHGCAIRDDDAVVCWGDNQQLEGQPP